MNYILNHLKQLDWKLNISALILSCIGLVSIFSISAGRGDFGNFYKQIFFLATGLVLMFLLSIFDWRGFKDNSYLILVLYFICIILLAGLLIFAPQTRGIKGWYRLGFFSFDPIGITIVVLIILLSKFFSKRHIEMYKIHHVALSGFYTLLPFVLIAKQPNLGSALVLIAIWLGVLIVSGIKYKHLLLLAVCGILIFSVAWSFFLRDYQKKRITSFLNPSVETLGMNWSQTQSKIAIGSGGLLGQGFSEGSQTQNGFLSEPYTDFIFSAYAEEFGMVGVSILLLVFLFFLWRILRFALTADSNFPRLFASGFAMFIFFQAFVNIGMNLGVLPVIGLPMPLISYGGSNLIAIFAGLGILQSIKSNS
ncbi:MAG: FtsW/RodA/SpoVE family cell cycle protein [bacterium]|nr:FtsW/RodA/SpoVE family cell cycle protein [bacterium]